VITWKWFAFGLGFIAIGVAAIAHLPSVQRKRDLAETLAWMDQTYNPHDDGENLGQGHGSIALKAETGTLKVKMSFVRLGGCKIAINRGFYSDHPSEAYTLSLCDIDPVSIKVETFEILPGMVTGWVSNCADNCDGAIVGFLTRDGAAAINEERFEVEVVDRNTRSLRDSRIASKTNTAFLYADDVNYAKRFARALKHAVELCGGKPSDFWTRSQVKRRQRQLDDKSPD
jgi:hypothetical protein